MGKHFETTFDIFDIFEKMCSQCHNQPYVKNCRNDFKVQIWKMTREVSLLFSIFDYILTYDRLCEHIFSKMSNFVSKCVCLQNHMYILIISNVIDYRSFIHHFKIILFIVNITKIYSIYKYVHLCVSLMSIHYCN